MGRGLLDREWGVPGWGHQRLRKCGIRWFKGGYPPSPGSSVPPSLPSRLPLYQALLAAVEDQQAYPLVPVPPSLPSRLPLHTRHCSPLSRTGRRTPQSQCWGQCSRRWGRGWGRQRHRSARPSWWVLGGRPRGQGAIEC